MLETCFQRNSRFRYGRHDTCTRKAQARAVHISRLPWHPCLATLEFLQCIWETLQERKQHELRTGVQSSRQLTPSLLLLLLLALNLCWWQLTWWGCSRETWGCSQVKLGCSRVMWGCRAPGMHD